MKPIISEKDFPTANKFVYLNTANVALTFSGAEQGLKDWVSDVAQMAAIILMNTRKKMSSMICIRPLHK
jgi:hypothetical protein